MLLKTIQQVLKHDSDKKEDSNNSSLRGRSCGGGLGSLETAAETG
jgi:hypothetical protein